MLAKLERLQQLLLSNDLDFEMRLERLRQIRETLKKLDSVIKEESREEKLSKKAAAKEKELAELAKRRAALEELVKQQTAHIEKNKPLAKKTRSRDAEHEAAAKLGEAQEATRKSTEALAADSSGGGKKNLSDAGQSMKYGRRRAGQARRRRSSGPPMEKALAALKKELDETAKKEAEAKEALKKENFAAMKKDQEGNRGATDEVTEMTRQLGNNGLAASTEPVQCQPTAWATPRARSAAAGRSRQRRAGQGPQSAQGRRRAIGRRSRAAGPPTAPRGAEARHRGAHPDA